MASIVMFVGLIAYEIVKSLRYGGRINYLLKGGSSAKPLPLANAPSEVEWNSNAALNAIKAAKRRLSATAGAGKKPTAPTDCGKTDQQQLIANPIWDSK